MLHELLRTLISWALISPAAFLAGTLFSPLVKTEDRLLRGIFFYALGFAALSYGVVALSAAGFLTPFAIWGLLAFFLIVRCNKLGEWLAWHKEVVISFSPGRALTGKILTVFFAVSAVCLLMATLSPELGGDALCYQLNLPKVFLRAGSLVPNFFDFNSYFPLFMTNLYLVGLATGGVFAAKSFHFFCGVLLFLALRRLLENETKNPLLSFFLALVVWITPAIYNLLSTTYIDVALAFYTLLAVVSFIGALRNSDNRGFLLSGVLAGCGVAMKYLSLIVVVGLGAVWLFDVLVTRKFRSRFAGAFLFVAGLLAVCGYWLLRNWTVTGNPFFPYWGEWFGLYHRPPTDHFLLGLGRSWFHFVSMYFNMFLQPNYFGSWSTRIGVFYFLFLPFILFAMIAVPRARKYGIFGFVFTFLIYHLAQADRWIIPALPVMTICAGMGIQWCNIKLSGRVALFLKKAMAILAVGILSAYVLAGIFHYRFPYKLWVGQWSLNEYLTKMERTIPVANWINENLPEDSLILVEGEPRVFYINKPILRGVYLKWRYQNEKLFEDTTSFHRLLKSVGVTHVLTYDAIGGGKDMTFLPSIRKLVMTPAFSKRLFSVESKNVRDVRYHYDVYELL